MTRPLRIPSAIAALLLWLANQALGAELPQPHQIVQQTTEEVVELLADAGQGGQQVAPDAGQLLTVLEPVVAFDQIARAVIGDHRNSFNAEQTAEFVDTFKRSMTRLYLDSLMAFDIRRFTVNPPDTEPAPDADSAVVEVDVVDQNDKAYRLEYFLGRSDQGGWQVRNIIVDGVNLGLSYRNQFASAMTTYNNDPQQVIERWDELVDEK